MDLDAYEDDMTRFLRLSDEDVERLFRGLAPEENEDLRDLATFLAESSGSLSAPPRRDVEARHLARLVEALAVRSADAHDSSLPVATRIGRSPAARSSERRGPIRRRAARWAGRVVVTAAGMVGLTAALALAGVDLPGTAAETAFEKVLGVELPNQDRDAAADAVDPTKLPADASDTAVSVLTVINEWFSGAPWSGCEFGARVSHAARGLEGGPDTSHCGAAGTGGQGHGRGQGAGASGNAANGLEKAREASNGAASHGAAPAEAGRDIAEEASSGRMGEAAGVNAGS
jgi:hypothetical protein